MPGLTCEFCEVADRAIRRPCLSIKNIGLCDGILIGGHRKTAFFLVPQPHARSAISLNTKVWAVRPGQPGFVWTGLPWRFGTQIRNGQQARADSRAMTPPDRRIAERFAKPDGMQRFLQENRPLRDQQSRWASRAVATSADRARQAHPRTHACCVDRSLVRPCRALHVQEPCQPPRLSRS